ncbi:MAG: hypothetical protein H6737_05710 [Alphaproteobacteria bacterium]|nr:hypothetical protein [Alphaproteobacteria bacterium]
MGWNDGGSGLARRAIAAGLVASALVGCGPQSDADWMVADNFGCIAVALVALSGGIAYLVMNRYAVGDDDEDLSDIY